MAKSSGNAGLILVGVGAVAVLALVMSSKAKAGTNLGVKEVPPLPKNKPVVHVDADDEGEPVPRMLEQVEPPQASLMPDRYVPITSMPPEAPSSAASSSTWATEDGAPAGGGATAIPSTGGRWSVTNDDGSPVVANAALAKSKAQSIADHVRTKKSAYDRPKLAVWQALAGLPGVDGLYGPSTQQALSKYGAKNVPKPLFKGGK